ncbi:PIF1-like helicase-domain-containing protein [Blyttiomyces helicus]|uniref:ATP-dependent DNA helicase n=1 Tax=Blyttiomyces helicus TaxID=388810 RepID=A0A4V1IRD4_9FUNG|nr:PIF1-like helicase-domain-containing protein [Blyttiomyces helicus]|eukprot:RKO89667.1 PIF1-like helicase-domain-containing protein [Blyttiomyces helicus]
MLRRLVTTVLTCPRLFPGRAFQPAHLLPLLPSAFQRRPTSSKPFFFDSENSILTKPKRERTPRVKKPTKRELREVERKAELEAAAKWMFGEDGAEGARGVRLTEEQDWALKLFLAGKNCPAETSWPTETSPRLSQTWLLHEFIKLLRISKLTRTAVTASTGTTLIVCKAAVLLPEGGSTINSWGGIGLGDRPAAELAETILARPRAKSRWNKTHVLIIDEISMVSDGLMDKLNIVAQKVRNDPRPFGGIQVIVCGAKAANRAPRAAWTAGPVSALAPIKSSTSDATPMFVSAHSDFQFRRAPMADAESFIPTRPVTPSQARPGKLASSRR